MQAPEDPQGLFGMIATGLGGLGMGILWLRKKLSSDAAAIANDRAEVDMIERLQTENRELRTALGEVTEERNKLYREVGEMAGSIRALEASQKQLEAQVKLLTGQIGTLRGALEKAGHERRTP